MSRFPEIALSFALAAAMLTPAAAQDTAIPVDPAEAAQADVTVAPPEVASDLAETPAGDEPAPDAPAAAEPAEAVDAAPDVAPTPGASAASDTTVQQEGAGEIPVEAEPETVAEPGADQADAEPAAEDGEAAETGTASAYPGAGMVHQLGREALPEEVAAWDTDVRPDGQGLPEGSGDVETGETLFADYCASCHGDFAEGVDNWPKLAGGMDTLDREDPLKTVGSYWPYLSTAWDYVHRSMPFGSAQILTPDETYAMVAYILYSNDLVDDDFVLNRETFAEVELPNVDGFIEDDRDTVELPEFTKEACMENCKETVEITRRATILDVTPGSPDDADAGDDAPMMD